MIHLKKINEHDERKTDDIFINPDDISSIVDTSFRSLYGGSFPITRVNMKNGDSFLVNESPLLISRKINKLNKLNDDKWNNISSY